MTNINPSKIAESENAYAIVDSQYAHRWLDAWGDVEKAVVDGIWRADEFVVTATGTSPITASVLPGAVALITTGGTEYNGDEIQLVGSRFKFESGKPCYFGAKVTVSDATQSDFVVGLAGVDTTLTASSSAHAMSVGASGALFTKLDGATTVNFKTYQTATETNSAAAETLDTSATIYEMYFDGTKLFAYVDGSLVATLTDDLPTAVMTPSLVIRTGATAAKTATLHWMRAFQVRS